MQTTAPFREHAAGLPSFQALGDCALPVVHVSSLAPGDHAIDLSGFDHADAYLVSPVHPESTAALIDDLLRKRADPA